MSDLLGDFTTAASGVIDELQNLAELSIVDPATNTLNTLSSFVSTGVMSPAQGAEIASTVSSVMTQPTPIDFAVAIDMVGNLSSLLGAIVGALANAGIDINAVGDVIGGAVSTMSVPEVSTMSISSFSVDEPVTSSITSATTSGLVQVFTAPSGTSSPGNQGEFYLEGTSAFWLCIAQDTWVRLIQG